MGIESLDTELGAGTFSGLRRLGMEHALGRTLTDVDLVSVADSGVVYDERVVHRRRQPGRAYLSEMSTNLSFSRGAGIRGAGVVDARQMGSSVEFTVGRLANVSGNVQAREAAGDATVQSGVVNGIGSLTLGAFVEAPEWRVGGALTAGSGRARQDLQASSVSATASLEAGPVLAVDDEVEASSALFGNRVWARAVNGRAPDGFSGTVEGTQRLEGMYGVADEMRVDGNLEVTEQCYGCGPEGD